jgi:glyoxylase-like metal-dependent hydrolase (beta-lactamase superfamily II)
VPDLADFDIALVRADNPGPFTLSGTNTWLLGRNPAWVVDPGPEGGGHLDAVMAEAEERGGVGGIAVTHDHADHAESAAELRRRAGDPPLGAARPGLGTVTLVGGDGFGPLIAVATPGHAADHLAFVAGGVCFTGDAVLGEGSVYIAPDPGALRGYLDALHSLRALPLAVLCPGHGPPVFDPGAKLDEYVAHRLDRERRLLDALARGLRAEGDLLDAAWDDAPAALRPAVVLTLRAHLDKLRDEGRLPPGAGEPRGRDD